MSTLHVDKPMRDHTLMQAIARANRIFPGKECGLIVDYNGILKTLREALAKYSKGDEEEGAGAGDVLAPLEELLAALVEAIQEAESHLGTLGFDMSRLKGNRGFA